MRKLESLSIDELVTAFATKFNLKIYKDESEVDDLPCIVLTPSKSGRQEYYAYFKSSLVTTPYKVKLMKKVILNPKSTLNKFQLEQLRTSSNDSTEH